MKKILFFLMVAFMGINTVNAQTPEDPDAAKKQEKLQALYVAFITNKLQLSESEAQAFWPVHNEFDKEIKAVGMDLSELKREELILNIKKKYEPRFTKILADPKRVDRLFKLNGEFRKKLVERMRNQQNGIPLRPKLRRGV
ncbi:hypothetical protein [Ferruginibacter sp. SUN106]|uniref:hypothetical protein n=1 Tax=Ferruginibacter sp. SUN106 TaxID=2978348 RepID=UPI003D35EE02